MQLNTLQPKWFAIAVLTIMMGGLRSGCAQSKSTTEYYPPLTNVDGLRYPLDIAPLTWRVLGSGIYPVRGSDGRMHLAYALMFTNSWSFPATIKSVEVVDPEQGNKISGTNRVLSIRNEDVTNQVKLFSLPTTQNKANYSSQLGGGQSGVMFFDVTYPEGTPVPKSIAHRVTVALPPHPGLPAEVTVTSLPVKLGHEAMVIAPPMKGDGWVNGNGCCLEIGPHRFVTNPMNGTLDPSEQFAIDWIKVDKRRHACKTDCKTSQDWLDYGVDVLAVAPGTVVEVVRDLPDATPGKAPDGLTIAQIAGNRVIMDLGSGTFVMYAHLVPNSVTVQVGDYVRQGQKIGLLGNYGNSDAPHLHFQLMDHPSSLDATSLPFVIDKMQLEGRVPMDLDQLDTSMRSAPVPIDTKAAQSLIRTMPLSRDVTGFD